MTISGINNDERVSALRDEAQESRAIEEASPAVDSISPGSSIAEQARQHEAERNKVPRQENAQSSKGNILSSMV